MENYTVSQYICLLTSLPFYMFNLLKLIYLRFLILDLIHTYTVDFLSDTNIMLIKIDYLEHILILRMLITQPSTNHLSNNLSELNWDSAETYKQCTLSFHVKVKLKVKVKSQVKVKGKIEVKVSVKVMAN